MLVGSVTPFCALMSEWVHFRQSTVEATYVVDEAIKNRVLCGKEIINRRSWKVQGRRTRRKPVKLLIEAGKESSCWTSLRKGSLNAPSFITLLLLTHSPLGSLVVQYTALTAVPPELAPVEAGFI